MATERMLILEEGKEKTKGVGNRMEYPGKGWLVDLSQREDYKGIQLHVLAVPFQTFPFNPGRSERRPCSLMPPPQIPFMNASLVNRATVVGSNCTFNIVHITFHIKVPREILIGLAEYS